MHEVWLRMKRAYLSSLHKVQKGMLAPMELTPARFDLMYHLKTLGGSSWASALRKALGVCAVTVIRMVRSLEELGFVKTSRSPRDKRQLVVEMTPEGRSRTLRAIRELVESEVAHAVVSATFIRDRWWDDAVWLNALDPFENRLRVAQTKLGDPCSVHYPWHPDD